ncbi:MAG: hypothetical protein U0521_05770 [Anaerolineae bacterium]
MRDFYEDFYRLTATSTAHAEFCERVFGRDLCQHGFADMTQLDALMAALRLQPGARALDNVPARRRRGGRVRCGADRHAGRSRQAGDTARCHPDTLARRIP